MSKKQAKSKPTKIIYSRDWEGPSNTIYYFNIEFEDGTVGQFGTTKRDQTKFTEGQETVYSAELKNPDSDRAYYKIDTVNEEYTGRGGGGKMSPEVDRSILANVCLDCAMNVVHGLKMEKTVVPDLKSLHALANKFYKFVDDFAGSDKQRRITTQARLKQVTSEFITLPSLEIKSSDDILEYVKTEVAYVEDKMRGGAI